MTPMLWVLVAVVAVAAIYFVFVRKLLQKPAAATDAKAQVPPPAAP